jgi:hypothetical protein
LHGGLYLHFVSTKPSKELRMEMLIWIVAIIVALALGAGAAWYFMTRRRSQHLRERFGPEYDRTVERSSDRRHAEADLEAREEHVRRLDIRPLSATDQSRFANSWREVQSEFVDAPGLAVGRADKLVTEVMMVRGYPVEDFDQRAADISVDHPRVVENYREARYIARRNSRSEATTEELRQAMVHYRVLFEELIGVEAHGSDVQPHSRTA